MKHFLFLSMNFLLLSGARAGEVQCSMAMSNRDDALLRIQYQVDGSGAATSKIRLQYVSGSNFIAQTYLEVAKSGIDPVNEKIELSSKRDSDGNEIHFEAVYRGSEVDVYTGIARGTLREDRPFERAIVCSYSGGAKNRRTEPNFNALALPKGAWHEMVDPIRASAENVLHPETALISSIKTLPDFMNARVLHQKYVVERLSLKQIARQFASSKSAVSAALRRAKIPLRAPTLPHGSAPANPAYGKRIVKGKLVDHPAEQRAIQLVMRMAAEGRSTTAIAAKLSEMGFQTRAGHTRWHHETIRLMLKRNSPRSPASTRSRRKPRAQEKGTS